MRVQVRQGVRRSRGLTAGKEYTVVGLDDRCFRVVSDRGEPVLYQRTLFTIIDPEVPADWVWQRINDDEYYADPPELALRGFYEDWFDDKQYAIERFQAFIDSIGLGITARPNHTPPDYGDEVLYDEFDDDSHDL